MEQKKKIFLTIGLAGSGKTTFCQRLYTWISSKKLELNSSGLNKHIYSANLDPAVLNAKMPLSFDIRDSIDYEDIMDRHKLGPNGAILTALNLFCLNIDEFIKSIKGDYVIIDVPGQIETFSWSASGEIIVNLLNSLKDYEVNLLFLVDAERALNSPSAFMSNMMYAASVKCRFNCKFTIVFTKKDLAEIDRLNIWMDDYEKFIEELKCEEEFEESILNSMALRFEPIYKDMERISVSAALNIGKEDFFSKFSI